MNQCTGFLLGNRIVVFDYDCANKIYWNGYYGTFLGVYKPKSKEINSPLELSLIEAVDLVEKRRLKVIEGNKELTIPELVETGKARIQKFTSLLKVYIDLRRRGFIPRRGLKFGCDYLVYKLGPGIDHAPFGVLVYTERERVDPIELVRAGRLLHSVRKKLVIAIVNEDSSDVKYMVLNWWKP
ncbi:MAG: tRNA-intron lyase [Desulfurococcaceae archaeon]